MWSCCWGRASYKTQVSSIYGNVSQDGFFRHNRLFTIFLLILCFHMSTFCMVSWTLTLVWFVPPITYIRKSYEYCVNCHISHLKYWSCRIFLNIWCKWFCQFHDFSTLLFFFVLFHRNTLIFRTVSFDTYFHLLEYRSVCLRSNMPETYTTEIDTHFRACLSVI